MPAQGQVTFQILLEQPLCLYAIPQDVPETWCGGSPQPGAKELSFVSGGEISGNEDLVTDGSLEGFIRLDEPKLTIGTAGKVTAGKALAWT